jgi:hypothetical protein
MLQAPRLANFTLNFTLPAAQTMLGDQGLAYQNTI